MKNRNDEQGLEERVAAIESTLRQERSPSQPSEIARLVDDAVRPIRDSHFDAFKAYTTVLFTALALLLGVLGVLSRIEVRDQVRDMQNQFEKQETALQKKFDEFAGESLKRPQIELLHNGVPLEGQSVSVPFNPNVWPKNATIDSLFIRNTGDRTTEPIALRFAISRPVQLTYNRNPNWELSTSYEKQYAAAFYSSKQVAVHPGETFNIQPLVLDWAMGAPADNVATTALCKLEVFYGDAKPSEALFTVTFEPK